MSLEAERKKLPALTGLRFLAALFVLISHLLPKVMPFAHEPGWYHLLTRLSGPGMTLFFVLSGFVIHYNYGASLDTGGRRGLYNFFVARLTRIYPLYIIVIGYQLLISFCYSQLPAATFAALPSYLLMAQSWFYWPVGNFGLVYELGYLPAVAWSISTEWFFYLIYPAARLVLKHSSSTRARLTLAAILSTLAFGAMAWAGIHTNHLNHWGTASFGTVSDASQADQYSFSRWLLLFSPYSRGFEFLLGCICAALFISKQHMNPSPAEERLGLVVLLCTIVLTAILQRLLFAHSPPAIISQLHFCFGFAPSMAIIIFCCGRYSNAVSRFLSSWPLVLCGEASYSLYLWHMIIVMAFRWEVAPVISLAVGVGDLLKFILAVTAAIGLSLVSWRMIEVPARNWLRPLLSLKLDPGINNCPSDASAPILASVNE